MNTQKVFDFGLILNALGMIIVVALDIAFNLPERIFNILSILFVVGGAVCVYFHNRYKRIERNEEDSI